MHLMFIIIWLQSVHHLQHFKGEQNHYSGSNLLSPGDRVGHTMVKLGLTAMYSVTALLGV